MKHASVDQLRALEVRDEPCVDLSVVSRRRDEYAAEEHITPAAG